MVSAIADGDRPGMAQLVQVVAAFRDPATLDLWHVHSRHLHSKQQVCSFEFAAHNLTTMGA
jgi:hypothetical protein